VTTREGIVVRVDTMVADGKRVPLMAGSDVEAALLGMLQVGEKSRKASARPTIEAPRKTVDCCSYRALAGVADSAFGELPA
jgi:hypothetical protein